MTCNYYPENRPCPYSCGGYVDPTLCKCADPTYSCGGDIDSYLYKYLDPYFNVNWRRCPFTGQYTFFNDYNNPYFTGTGCPFLNSCNDPYFNNTNFQCPFLNSCYDPYFNGTSFQCPYYNRCNTQQPFLSGRPYEKPEERRQRARETLSKLQELVAKSQVKLSREFTVDDDPNEIEKEYTMHKDIIDKNNAVKFYKQILLNVCCAAEFFNEKYDPYGIKLKDWSKKIANAFDDYTDVLGELYEKYKNSNQYKMTPEQQLFLKVMMDGAIHHLSQSLFRETNSNLFRGPANQLLVRQPN
jgi:hypothetical protein